MINLKGYNFLFGKKAVSPVIGTILMVAVTVIMASIVGGFVYQTAKPKIPPTISSSVADDPMKAVGADDGGAATYAQTAMYVAGTDKKFGNRVAKLFFEGGVNISPTELKAIVTYTTNASSPAEITVNLDGVYWKPSTPSTGIPTGTTGTVMAIGKNAASFLWLIWADVDGSGDMTPGDRIDFYESDKAPGSGVKLGTDFTVKILHQATQGFIADFTIRVY